MRAALFTLAVFLAAVILTHAPHALATDSEERAAIEHLMRGTWERPDARLEIDPIVVVGNHAIAGWTQGDHGGRALLRRTDVGWVVTLCAGDGLKATRTLIGAGIPSDEAALLAEALAAAEQTVDPVRLGLLSTFEGEVVIEGSGAKNVPHHQSSSHSNQSHE
jgi:hypothetical protein